MPAHLTVRGASPLGWRWGRSGADNDVRGPLNPLALVVDTGEVADGANDVRGRGFSFGRCLQDVAQGEAKITGAAIEEAAGVGVAIDRAPN